MSITFGFITDGKNDELLMQGIHSAINSGIDDFEVIVIGNSTIQHPGVRIINFNESDKIGWITRKKNLVAKESTKEILVILHDYLELGELWNQTNIQVLLSSSWDVAVCRIENLDGTRFRDWLIWPFSNRLLKLPFTYTLKCLLPYNFNKAHNLMYIYIDPTNNDNINKMVSTIEKIKKFAEDISKPNNKYKILPYTDILHMHTIYLLIIIEYLTICYK